MSQEDIANNDQPQQGFIEMLMQLLQMLTAGQQEEPQPSSAKPHDNSQALAALLGSGQMSFSDSVVVPENTSGKYQLFAQMTGTERAPEGYDVAVGKLVLVAPDGSKQEFAFNSGSSQNAKNMLPGLCADLNGSSIGNADYKLDFANMLVDSAALPKGMKVDGTGSWIRLGSNPDQTSRGGVIGQDTSGFLGIHTDGGRSGTAGCLGMSEQQSDAFFKALQSVPEALRPTQLVVLKPVSNDIAQDVGIGSGLPASLSRRVNAQTPRLP